MSDSLSVKVFVGTDIRRLGVPGTIDFKTLQSNIATTFNIKLFSISYDDDEGDRIKITSNLELEEAKRLQPKLLKLFVNEESLVKQVPVTEEKEEEEEEKEEEKIQEIPSTMLSTLLVAEEEEEPASKLDMKLSDDLTIKDGTKVSGNIEFEKRWLVENTGNVAWPAGSTLLPIGSSNEELGWTSSGATTKTIAPGERVSLGVALTSPSKPGRYVGHWKLFTPSGVPIGSRRLWCDLTVPEPVKTPEKVVEVVPKVEDIVETKIEKIEEEKEEEGEEETPEPKYDGPFSEQMNHLQGMGFDCVEFNLALLKQYKGDLTKVIEKLLS